MFSPVFHNKREAITQSTPILYRILEEAVNLSSLCSCLPCTMIRIKKNENSFVLLFLTTRKIHVNVVSKLVYLRKQITLHHLYIKLTYQLVFTDLPKPLPYL